MFIIVKVFKSSTERITKLSKKIIADTTELTKKQVKALKKKVKKAEKKGEEVDVDKLVEEVKTEQPAAVTETTEAKVEDKPAETTKEPDPVKEPEVSTNTATVETKADKDDELLSVLKEIRDSLKSSK